MKTDGWTLFNSCFKKDEEVFLITDRDYFDWGKIIEFDNNGIKLQKNGKRPRRIKWIDIRFMSHDGFPVRKLMSSKSDKFIEQLDCQVL